MLETKTESDASEPGAGHMPDRRVGIERRPAPDRRVEPFPAWPHGPHTFAAGPRPFALHTTLDFPADLPLTRI
ncbi:hypothetical protein DF048_15420 [Burkholderia seminalis]|nr:hypothetical protein DF048_15420 [Burkholderia seminalis]